MDSIGEQQLRFENGLVTSDFLVSSFDTQAQ